MTMELVTSYFLQYGSLIIFIALFFGIVGIPAPEESFLVFLGIICVKGDLSLLNSFLFALFGTITGMIVAYSAGKIFGNRMINKFGKYIGVTEERWQHMKERYEKRAALSIVFGLYLPGIRQVNPYFAGASHIPFTHFILFSLIGSLLWVTPYMLGGFIFGRWFNIPVQYVSILGFVLLFLFFSSLLIKFMKRKQVTV